LVNSEYTAQIAKESFTDLKRDPIILYPPVDVEKYAPISNNKDDNDSTESQKNKIILLSINRFERKKNIGLAIKALSSLRSNIDPKLFSKLQLVIAGGYDLRVSENRHYLSELEEMAEQNYLLCKTLPISSILSSEGDNDDYNIIFMPSISDAIKLQLLSMAFLVIYTPSYEHFGIVPLEAMASGVPVIAMNSGGPKETIVDSRTGFLCEEDPDAVARAIKNLIEGKFYRREDLSEEAREHVKKNFNFENFGNQLEFILETNLYK
jgi:alpha-1,3/alpha-1,6-mannosyltransferase